MMGTTSLEDVLNELPAERRERILAEAKRLCAEYPETLKDEGRGENDGLVDE